MMPGMRRSRWHIVAALMVLLLQMGSAVASATGVCCTTPAAAAAADDDACCRGLAPGQMCPLHKHRAGQHHTNGADVASSASTHHASGADHAGSPGAPGGCVMRNGCDTQPAGLESLSFGLGVLPSADAVIERTQGSAIVCAPSSFTIRSLFPDLPPPRA